VLILQEEMFDCEACYCTTYCSEQHKEEDRDRHSKYCRSLLLDRISNTYEVAGLFDSKNLKGIFFFIDIISAFLIIFTRLSSF
jgi:hypothetical protein